jgi:WG containing repeat
MKKHHILFLLAILFALQTTAQVKVIASHSEKKFKNGYLAIKRGNYWGYVDTLGNEVSLFTDEGINDAFSNKPSVSVFTANRYVSYNSKDNKTSLYGKDNKLITNKYVSIHGFYDSLSVASVKVSNPKRLVKFDWIAVYIKPDGKQAFSLPQGAINNAFNLYNVEKNVGNFSEGLAYIAITKKDPYITTTGDYGYMNKVGKLVIPAKYKQVSNFSEGRAIVKGISQYGDDKWGVIDKTGKEITALTYSNQPSDFLDGMSIITNSKNLYGYMDLNGNIALEPKYAFASSFSNNQAVVKEGEYSFKCTIKVIDKTGKTVKELGINDDYIFPKFSILPEPSFANGLLICQSTKPYNEGKFIGNYGALDNNGNEIIPFKFDMIEQFSCNRAFAKQGEKQGFIDTKGNWIIEIINPEY